MGTSSSYAPPTKGNWGNIKRGLSSIVNSPSFSEAKALGLLAAFVSEKGGGGSATQSSYGNWTGPAKDVSRGIAGFISDVGRIGVAEALKRRGLGDLVGKPFDEVISGILDTFGGNANTRDEVNARRALDKTMDELLKNMNPDSDIDSVLIDLASTSLFNDFLLNFLGYYIYEQFNSTYEEFLKTKTNDDGFEEFMGGIEDTILAAVESKALDLDILVVNWNDEQGQDVIDQIMVEVFEIFGG